MLNTKSILQAAIKEIENFGIVKESEISEPVLMRGNGKSQINIVFENYQQNLNQNIQTISIENSFDALAKTVNNLDIELPIKAEIVKGLEEIKSEMKKESTDTNKLKSLIEKIIQKAEFLKPVLTNILTEIIKNKLGL